MQVGLGVFLSVAATASSAKAGVATAPRPKTKGAAAKGASKPWPQALADLDQARHGRDPPAPKIMKAAVIACKEGKQWDRAAKLLREGSNLRYRMGQEAWEAGIYSAAQADMWRTAYNLIEDMDLREDLTPSKDAFQVALKALDKHGQTARAAHLLAAMREYGHTPDLKGLSTPITALDKAGTWDEALDKLEEDHGPPIPLRPLARPIGPPLETMEIKPGNPYAKEIRLLQHVFREACRGEPVTVCAAIEQFGEGVLGGRGQWLKVAGGAKSGCLRAVMQGAPPGGQILEVGAYCGFSSSQMTMAVPGVQISTLEVDPVHVVIARSVINFGGLTKWIDVWTGHSKDILPRLRMRYGNCQNLKYSAAFFDQKGSRYDEDLTALERLQLLKPGAVLVADNVLKPGAPIFLWHLFCQDNYEAQVVTMQEFAMEISEDWMTVSVQKEQAALDTLDDVADYKKQLAEDLEAMALRGEEDVWPEGKDRFQKYELHDDVPEELKVLSKEADRMRDKAIGKGSVPFQEWAKFANDVKRRVAPFGIEVTAQSY